MKKRNNQRNPDIGYKLPGWEVWQGKHRTNKDGNFKRMKSQVKMWFGLRRVVRNCEWRKVCEYRNGTNGTEK